MAPRVHAETFLLFWGRVADSVCMSVVSLSRIEFKCEGRKASGGQHSAANLAVLAIHPFIS